MSIQLNRGFKNIFLVSRIANTRDESTLAGCIGQPSIFIKGIHHDNARILVTLLLI